MALFSQYAIAASEEALKDAGWVPTNDHQREQTVDITCGCGRLGVGMMLMHTLFNNIGRLLGFWYW